MTGKNRKAIEHRRSVPLNTTVAEATPERNFGDVDGVASVCSTRDKCLVLASSPLVLSATVLLPGSWIVLLFTIPFASLSASNYLAIRSIQSSCNHICQLC